MLPLCLKEAEVAEKLLTVRDMAVLDDKRNAQDEPLDDEEDSSSDEEEAARDDDNDDASVANVFMLLDATEITAEIASMKIVNSVCQQAQLDDEVARRL